MKKYILNENIALRSWRLVPYAYYIKHERNARGLKADEFAFFSSCDGVSLHDADGSEKPFIEKFTANGMIRAAKDGETMTEWQKLRTCDNRYFPAMNWMITGRCNYNCLHCFNASDNAPLMSEFSLEEAKKLLDEAEACGINAFTITGGEPMLHKHFFEIIEEIYARGMYVEELNTNGFFINEESLSRFRSIGCDPLIKISFDGVGHHDWLRNRKGVEEDALRAIRLCKEKGFRVKVQTNVHRKNVSSMLETAKLMDGMGVEEMRIIRTTEVPRWNKNAAGATLDLDEYYDRMLEFTGDYIKEEHKMNIDIWQFLTLFPKSRSYRARPVECGKGEYRDSIPVCRGNRGMVAVAANGNVFPCMQMSGYYEARGDVLGNVKTDGLKFLLQSGKYIGEVCMTLGELASKNETCANCKYFKYCAGGCRAIGLTLTGDKCGSDLAKCLYFNKGYYEKTAVLLKEWRNILPMDVT